MDDLLLTQAPKKLPSIVGKDVMDLRKLAPLESREKVINDLKRFIEICRKSKEPQLAMIVAEWGEGKTSLFEGFLKDLDEHVKTILVPGKNITSYVEKIQDGKINLRGETAGFKLLAAILLTISELFRGPQGERILPDHSNFDDIVSYVYGCLEKLVEYYNNKILILFVDEFEEIVTLKTEHLGVVLSGLVDIVNGYIKEISVGGKYEGKLHLILSITPPAYQRIITYSEFAQTINRMMQRLDIIKIPELTWEEGVRLAHGIVRYCYNDELPEIYPIYPLEIYNTIYKISLKNPRAIVDIMRILLSSAISEARDKGYNDKAVVINYDKFIQYLSGKRIFIYGGEVEVINNEMLSNCERILREWATYKRLQPDAILKVFRCLCAVQSPLSLDDIAKLTGLRREDVYISIHLINEALSKELGKKYGIACGVHTLKRLEGNYDSIREILEETLGYYTRLSSESIKEIINILTSLELKLSGKEILIEKHMFLPQKENAEYLLETDVGLTKGSVDIFIEKVYSRQSKSTFSVSSDDYFILSQKLTKLIFPAPEVMILDFIKDKDLRINVWRETYRELDKMEDEFRRSIRILLASCGIKVDDDEIYDYKLAIGEYKATVVSLSTIGNISDESVREIRERLEKIVKGAGKHLPHAIILFYTEDITPAAEASLKEIESDYRLPILRFNLRPIEVQQLVSVIRFCEKYLEILIKDLYKIIISKKSGRFERTELWDKIERYIDLDILLDKLGNIAENINLIGNLKNLTAIESLVIRPIYRDVIQKEADLVEIYKYYLAYPEEEFRPQEVFNFVISNILRFQIYGAKIGIISGKDIEDSEQQFINCVEKDLKINHLVEVAGSKYRIVQSPVEDRILFLLERIYNKYCPIDTLESCFIHHKDTPHWLFKNYYIHILESRGKIRVDSRENIVSLNEFDKMLTLISKLYEEFNENYKNRLIDIKKYGYFCTAKQRGYRVMILEEFKKVVDDYYDILNQYGRFNQDFGFRIARVIQKLIEHFNNRLLNYLKVTQMTIVGRVNSIRREITNISGEIEGMLKGLEQFGVNVDVNSLNEIQTLKLKQDEMKSIIEKIWTQSELEELIKQEWLKYKDKSQFPFYFRDVEKEPYRISIKWWLIDKLGLENDIEKLKNIIEKSKREINDIDKFNKYIREKFNEFRSMPLTNIIASQLTLPLIPPTQEMRSLRDLSEFLRDLKEELLKVINSKIWKELDKLKEKENELHTLLNTTQELERILGDFLENKFDNSATVSKNYENLKNMLEEMVKKGEKIDVSNILNKVNNFVKELKKVIDDYKRILEEKKDIIRKHILRIDRLMNIIRANNLNDKVSVNVQDVIGELNKAIAAINNVLKGKITKLQKFSELIDKANKLENYLKRIIVESRVLEAIEIEVLIATEEISREGKVTYLHELYEELKNRLNISEEKLDAALISLILKKGLITARVGG